MRCIGRLPGPQEGLKDGHAPAYHTALSNTVSHRVSIFFTTSCASTASTTAADVPRSTESAPTVQCRNMNIDYQHIYILLMF